MWCKEDGQTNQDTVGEQYIRNVDIQLWKQQNILEFTWYKNNLSQADTVSGVPCLIEKDMLKESVSNMENGKIAGLSRVVSEMIKAAGKAVVYMIIDLVNQIIIEEVVPAE